MIAKPFATFFFILFAVWLGSIFVTSDNSKRLDRSCYPVQAVGKLSASVMSLFGTELESETKKGFEKLDKSCQYIVWRQFYADEDKERLQRIQELETQIKEREAEIERRNEEVIQQAMKQAKEEKPKEGAAQ